MKIVISRELPIPVEPLKADFSEVVVLERGRPTTREELLSHVRGAHTLLCVVTDRIDDGLLQEAKDLKHVITYSVGVDHIDLAALQRRKIRLSFAPDVLSTSTAELTWALILGCARRIKPATEFLQAGQFVGIGPKLFLGKELRNKTLGIIGMGRIGTCVARMAGAFAMNVIYFAHKEEATPRLTGTRPVNWGTLLRESDVLSVHCPLKPETRHLISFEALRAMKPDAILINTARGPIVDEGALVNHLKNTPSFSAGVDVFEQEPQIPTELKNLPNVLSLPHIGSATHDARGKMAEMCLGEASRLAKGLPLRYEYQM